MRVSGQSVFQYISVLLITFHCDTPKHVMVLALRRVNDIRAPPVTCKGHYVNLRAFREGSDPTFPAKKFTSLSDFTSSSTLLDYYLRKATNLLCLNFYRNPRERVRSNARETPRTSYYYSLLSFISFSSSHVSTFYVILGFFSQLSLKA